MGLLYLAMAETVPWTGHARADERSDALVKAYNSAGLALFGKLATEKPGNLVLSPYSIGTAMAMAYAGARGETAAEMARVLRYGADPAGTVEGYRSLNDSVSERTAGEDATITLANALHLTRFGHLVAPSYKTMLSARFSTELFEGSDLAAINNWVKRKTGGRIESILTRLDPLSVAVLLNAIHFKSSWAAPFNPRRTAPGDFHLSRDETVQVPMMHRSGSYRILRAHTFDAIALPYKGDKLTMIVLLPLRPGGHGQVAISQNDRMIRSVIHGLERIAPQTVTLSMPKFKTGSDADLIAPFTGLGMALAFDRTRADFTGITESTKEQDRIYISQIRHKTVIDVNEAGTEAAAATAVEFGRGATAVTPSIRIAIDRPFEYLITDRSSGAILFIGRVSDPRS